MAQLQDIKVPLLSVNDSSVTVVEIRFSNGDHVKKNEVIMVVETSKATYDIEADVDGYIAYLCRAGEDYYISEIVAKIYSENSEVEKVISSQIIIKKEETNQRQPSSQRNTWPGDTFFSSRANALIKSSGISKSLFQGKDFVNKKDVEEMLDLINKSNKRLSETTTGQSNQSRNLPGDAGSVTIEKLTSNKKKEIKYLQEVQSAALTSTVNTIVETNDIFVHINQSLKFLKNSLLPVIVYETARLLTKYKRLNAYFTGDGVALYNTINVGFAIDIAKGIKVAKIENAEKKNINEIEKDIIDLSNKYIDDNLRIEDMTGVTFIITDLSAEEVTFFTPLVNVMNSAVLGISSIDKKLHRCILSVTFDHRVTEGKMVAQFLKDLKHRIESNQYGSPGNLNKNITCFKCFKPLYEDLSDVGFAKCVTPNGNEAFICQSCLKGF